jgi:hypothetical protein
MSNWSDRPPYEPPPEGAGCITVLMILAGFILLVPGLCVAWIAFRQNTWGPPSGVILLILAIGGGIALIWGAVRRD